MFFMVVITLVAIIDLIAVIVGKKFIDDEYGGMFDLEDCCEFLMTMVAICFVIVPLGVFFVVGTIYVFLEIFGIWLLPIVIATISATIYMFWTPIKKWVEELEVSK